MNAFATPVLLGGPRFQMMAPLLYWAFGTDNNWPFAAAISVVFMIAVLIIVGILGALGRRSETYARP